MAEDDEVDEGHSSNWVIGVILMLIGSILNNLGNNLMSLGHSEQKAIDDLSMKRTMSRESLQRLQRLNSEDDTPNKAPVEGPMSPQAQEEAHEKQLEQMSTELEEREKKGTWWLTGTVVFVVGALLAFVSFGFAAQSLLAALESVQFVSNVFFHKYVHGMEITNRIIYSTSCILAGNILVVAFSSHASHVYDAADLAIIYEKNSGFHGYLIGSALVWFIAHATYAYYEKGRLEGKHYWRHNKLEPFCFVVSATLLGTQSVLHAKCLSMLMMFCFQGDNQFANKFKFTVWAILIAWFLFAAVYIQRINKGLSMYPVTFFIPSMTVCFAFFTILCGGIFFSEFERLSDLQLAMFCVGTTLIFAGVSQLEADEHESQVVPVDSEDEVGAAVPDLALPDGTRDQPRLSRTRQKSVLYPAPTTSIISENRQVIQDEFQTAVAQAQERATLIVTEGYQRVRAGSENIIEGVARARTASDNTISPQKLGESTEIDEEAQRVVMGSHLEGLDINAERAKERDLPAVDEDGLELTSKAGGNAPSSPGMVYSPEPN